MSHWFARVKAAFLGTWGHEINLWYMVLKVKEMTIAAFLVVFRKSSGNESGWGWAVLLWREHFVSHTWPFLPISGPGAERLTEENDTYELGQATSLPVMFKPDSSEFINPIHCSATNTFCSTERNYWIRCKITFNAFDSCSTLMKSCLNGWRDWSYWSDILFLQPNRWCKENFNVDNFPTALKYLKCLKLLPIIALGPILRVSYWYMLGYLDNLFLELCQIDFHSLVEFWHDAHRLSTERSTPQTSETFDNNRPWNSSFLSFLGGSYNISISHEIHLPHINATQNYISASELDGWVP